MYQSISTDNTKRIRKETKRCKAVLVVPAIVVLLSIITIVIIFKLSATKSSSSPSSMSSDKTTPESPNIVIFLADDLGYGDLETYGNPTSMTPAITKMASEGLVFTQFYTTSSLCSPSRAALLTGRYPVRSGIWPLLFFPAMTGGLPLNEITIAEIVKERGYSTSILGKWHLGVGKDGMYLPTYQGFDEYLGVPYSHDLCPCCTCYYPSDPCWNTCSSSKTYPPCPLYDGTDIIEQPVDLTTIAERFSQRARQFIRRNARGKKPFLLYYSFLHPHYPQFSGMQFRNTSRRGSYGDSVAEMDWCVRSVLDELRRNGVIDNTLVLFLSDNGPDLRHESQGGSAGPFKCGKGTTYEGGHRAPAIAYWPGRIRPGHTLALATHMDILPTITKLVHGNLPLADIDGVDMSSILFNRDEGLRDTFAFYPAMSQPVTGIFAIRHGKYKAHFYTAGNINSNNNNPDIDCRQTLLPTRHNPPLLFNLEEDPEERYNLSVFDYKSVVSDIERIKLEYEKSVVWGRSEILKRTSDDVIPCCDKECQDFPQCCRCPGDQSMSCPSSLSPSSTLPEKDMMDLHL